MPEPARPVPADTAAMDALIAGIRRGAEAVDRGERSLALEIGLLHRAGLLHAPAVASGPDGRWAASGAPSWLFEALFALGGASLPLARLYEGHVDALGLIWRYGGPAARTLAKEAAATGKLLGVWGADAPGARVCATAGPGENLTLGGSKCFASGLGMVALAVVTASDGEGGCRLLLVDADEPGRQDLAAWDMDGMAGSASGRFTLDGMRVPPTRHLGAAGALFAEPWFHGGLWRICAAQAGALQALATGLHHHLDMRHQSDDPVQRQRLAGAVLAAETALLWAQAAAAAMAPPVPHPDAIETPLLAREAVEQAAGRVLEVIERAAGTALHARSAPLGLMARDLRLYLRQASLDAKLQTALGLWLARRSGPAPDC